MRHLLNPLLSYFKVLFVKPLLENYVERKFRINYPFTLIKASGGTVISNFIV